MKSHDNKSRVIKKSPRKTNGSKEATENNNMTPFTASENNKGRGEVEMLYVYNTIYIHDIVYIFLIVFVHNPLNIYSIVYI